jgi:hypothetical protein
MTADAKQVLKSFDSLPVEEKHRVYVEIVRRAEKEEYGDLTDDELCRIADELFVEMDKEEAKDAAT